MLTGRVWLATLYNGGMRTLTSERKLETPQVDDTDEFARVPTHETLRLVVDTVLFD